MTELSRRPGGNPRASSPGALARVGADVTFVGSDVSYVATRTREEAWARLSSGMRQWAEQGAGAAIRDPSSGAPSVYWNCFLDAEAGGPRTATMSASYRLVMFGRRGLVVSTGTTENYIDAPDATGWRHQRYDLPVDGERVRSDHRRGYAPHAGNSVPPAVAGDGQPLLGEDVVRMFGHLPAETQHFLLEPFLTASVPPTADVLGRTDLRGGEYVETYWTYLFTGRWVGFAHTRRAVPYRSGLSGPALWSGSPEALALPTAPWSVAAWVAPVARPGAGVQPAAR